MLGNFLGKTLGAAVFSVGALMVDAVVVGTPSVHAEGQRAKQPAVGEPAIFGVGPAPVYGDDTPQPLLLNGANLSRKAELILRDKTDGREFRRRPAVLREPGRVLLMPVFGNRDSMWTVEVVNPDGHTTGEVAFFVQHSTPEQRVSTRTHVSHLIPLAYREQLAADGRNDFTITAPPEQAFKGTPDPAPTSPADAVPDSQPLMVAQASPSDLRGGLPSTGDSQASAPAAPAPALPPSASVDSSPLLDAARSGGVGSLSDSQPLMVAQADTGLPKQGAPQAASAAGSPFASSPLPNANPTSRPLDGAAPGGVGASPFQPSPEQRAMAKVSESAAAAASGQRPIRNGAPAGLPRARAMPVAAPAASITTVKSADAAGGGYAPGAGAGAVLSMGVPVSSGGGMVDQVVKPEVTTAVLVSNRDINRLVCSDDITDVVWSEERPVKVSKVDNSVLVKYLVEKQGESFTNVSDPVDLHIFCSGTVYTVVLHPQAMDSATVRLIPPVAKIAARLSREWSALPLEDKVQRLTLIAFRGDYPEGIQRKPIFENDARRHVTLYARTTAGQQLPVAGITVTGVYELSAEGTGLKATEYEVRTSQSRELRETDFLSPAFGDEVSVTLDPVRVSAGQPSRLIVVSRSVEHGS